MPHEKNLTVTGCKAGLKEIKSLLIVNKNVALKNNRKEILLLNVSLFVVTESYKETVSEFLYWQWLAHLVSRKRPENEKKVPLGENGEDNSNWFIYASNNPQTRIDPTGLEDDYSINLEALENQDYIVSFYDDNNENPITATFDGDTYTLGEDLDSGDPVPFDATFNVPEGSSLEIEGGDSKFNMDGSGEVNLPESLGRYNDVVNSDAFVKAMKKEKIYGGAEMAAGLGLIGFSFTLGAALAPETVGTAAAAPALAFKTGGALFGFGLARYMGANKNSIMEDIKMTILPPEAALSNLRSLK